MGLLDSARSLGARIAKEVREGTFDLNTIRQVFVAVPPGNDAKAIAALKQNVDQLTGATGSVLDRALTLRDLLDEGAITVQSGSTVIGSGVGSTIVIPTPPTTAASTVPELTTAPTPTGLTASGAVKSVYLSWDLPVYANAGGTQVWRSTTNALGTAVQIGTAARLTTSFVDTTAVAGTTYYYWVRAYLNTGDTGAYNAVSGVAGGPTLVGNTDLGALIVQAANLANGAVDLSGTKVTGTVSSAQIANGAVSGTKFASGIEPVTLVTSVPGVLSTNTVFNTTDGKLYRWTGAAYSAAVPTADLSGQITGTQITDGSVSTSKLAANAVTAAKIQAGTITSNEIAADTITAGNIAAGAITASELAANAVTAGKIAAGTVTANEIAANTITASQIAGGTITANELAANSVTAGKIAANAIAVGTAAIQNGAIVNAMIADATIGNAKIAALDAAKITTGTLSADRIATGSIDAKIANISAAVITSGTIDVARIGDASITNAKIAGLITSSDFDGTTSGGNQITGVGTTGWAIAKGNGTPGSSKMVIDAAHIRGQLTTGQLAVGSVTNVVSNGGSFFTDSPASATSVTFNDSVQSATKTAGTLVVLFASVRVDVLSVPSGVDSVVVENRLLFDGATFHSNSWYSMKAVGSGAAKSCTGVRQLAVPFTPLTPGLTSFTLGVRTKVLFYDASGAAVSAALTVNRAVESFVFELKV